MRCGYMQRLITAASGQSTVETAAWQTGRANRKPRRHPSFVASWKGTSVAARSFAGAPDIRLRGLLASCEPIVDVLIVAATGAKKRAGKVRDSQMHQIPKHQRELRGEDAHLRGQLQGAGAQRGQCAATSCTRRVGTTLSCRTSGGAGGHPQQKLVWQDQLSGGQPCRSTQVGDN